MSEWKQKTLGELAALGKGTIQTGPFGSQLHAADYVEFGIPCLMPVNLKNNKIDVSVVSYVSSKDAKRLSKHLVKAGDIIYSRRGDVTQKALITNEEEGFFCGTGCLLVRTGNSINSTFLFYYLSTPQSKVWIKNHAVGITMPNLNTKILSKFPVALPDSLTQQKIAHVLSTLDRKIELNNRINSELEAMAKLLYDYWFVQFDFPDANGKPYKSSGGKMVWNEEVKREIPEGWEVVKLAEIESRIITGKTPSTALSENFDGEIPFICIGDVRGNMHVFSTEMTLSSKGAASQKNKFIPKGAICVTCIASPGLVAFATKDSQTNQQLNSIVCESSENKYYLYFYLKDHFRYAKAKTGNTFANMNKEDFSSIRVIKPKDLVLKQFETLLKSSVESILLNSIQNQKLSELRDWLLPMLMNGQVRVKDVEEAVAYG